MLGNSVTLLLSSNEGFIGLKEEHSVYNISLILFFNEDPHFIQFRNPEKYI